MLCGLCWPSVAWLGLAGLAAPAASQGGPRPPVGEVLLVAAGDIADCGSPGDEATAALLDGFFPPGTPLAAGVVAALGDNAYESGSAREFALCYDPSWGRHRARTRPAVGNHEYVTSHAAGYYGYFGTAAGDPARGYYSYDLGAWHVVVLNSNCAEVGGCQAGSPQETWLRADLAGHPVRCVLAYFHHPRYSSSAVHGPHAFMRDLWQALYDAGTDVVLAGHDHLYERFARLDADGHKDGFGPRSFVVGTGGRGLYSFATPLTGSEVRDASTWGVLALALRPGGYTWSFVPVAGGAFTDSGSDTCRPD